MTILEPERKCGRVLHQESDELSQKAGNPVESFKHSAVREDMTPGLRRVTTLTLVSVMAWNIKPSIVLAYRGMIENGSGEPRTEYIVLVDIT